MTPRDLLARVRQRPFRPFRLIVSENGTYDIRHPEQLMVGRHSVAIGLPGDDGQGLVESIVEVDLLHVVRAEPLEAPTASPTNGS